MHEPVEILSPSRRSSPSTLFRTSFLFSFLSLFFPLLLVPPFFFISPFAAAHLSLLHPSTLYSLATRGYWSLSNLIFVHSGDAEKHLRAIKDRRWKGANCGLKERKRERNRRGETRMRLTAKRARDGKRYRRTIFVDDVKCRYATIDIECRRRRGTSRNSLL